MQSQFIEDQPLEVPESMLNPGSNFIQSDSVIAQAPSTSEPLRFHGHFEDCMEMYADARTVEKYLDDHQDWFGRCAYPMTVESLGQNGYALIIGRFGAFGYQVEPKVGLELMPSHQGVYRIRTIPVPNYTAPGYDVDFNAALELVEASINKSNLPGALTQVKWQLDLAVYIQFPKFIHKLPTSVIQSTGDRILCQIVRQVSRRLTYKVQQDFHTKLGIPFPQKSKKRLG
ncbi:MAG: hypothetical protein NVSMB70_11780 [Chamaesiphon sp.]